MSCVTAANFLGGDQERFIYQSEVGKAGKHVRERNCFRVPLSSGKIGPGSLSDISLHSQRQKALTVSEIKRKGDL